MEKAEGYNGVDHNKSCVIQWIIALGDPRVDDDSYIEETQRFFTFLSRSFANMLIFKALILWFLEGELSLVWRDL